MVDTIIKIVFNRKVSSSYHKSINDTINKELQTCTLNAIRARLEHTSKLSDEELLLLCSIEET